MKTKTVSSMKKLAWTNFSKYIRTRDCIRTSGDPTHGFCYTCGAHKPFKELQAGHFIPGRRPTVLFDERQVKAQCYRCNVGLHGNWTEFLTKMNKEFGNKEVDKMIEESKQIKQFKVYELEAINERYRLKLKELLK